MVLFNVESLTLTLTHSAWQKQTPIGDCNQMISNYMEEQQDGGEIPMSA
jgi:hypothetical protein